MKVETAFEQSMMSASAYLRRAVQEIDQVFGAGYAKKNPELVMVFIKTCQTDFEGALKYKQE